MKISNVDAYALRRVIARMDVPNDLQLSPMVQAIIAANDCKTPDGWNALSNIIAADPDVQSQVLAIDPKQPPTINHGTNRIPVPALPKHVQLSSDAIAAAEQVGGWWREAVRWGCERSPMTPKHFIEAGMLWAVGLVIARRVYVQLHQPIYPHLYLMIVAETSKYAKSTGMNTVNSLVRHAAPHMLIPSNTSSEAMMVMLSGQLPSNFNDLQPSTQELITTGRQYAAQRGFIMDEFSGLLANSKREHMAGFVELLMRLYDASESEMYNTKSGGLLEIKNPAISIMGATTPSALARVLTADDWGGGNMPRYLVMFRDEALPYTRQYGAFNPPTELVETLAALHRGLPKMRDTSGIDEQTFQPIRATIAGDAMARYQDYAEAMTHTLQNDNLNEQLTGSYSRLPLQAMKVALIAASVDWAVAGDFGSAPHITLGHWAIGQMMAEKGRDSLHRLLPVINESRDARVQRNLIAILKQNPAGMTIRDIVKILGGSTKDIRSALDVLLDSGEVETIEHKPVTGRPTTLYKPSEG